MPQFDVYPHPVEEWRSQSPYVVDIQSDHVRGVHNRLTIPLTHIAIESPGPGSRPSFMLPASLCLLTPWVLRPSRWVIYTVQ